MPAERLSMRKIREVLRLYWGGQLSARAVAQSCGMGRTTVREYVQRAEAAGLSWPLPEGLSDAELEARLFPPAPSVEGPRVLPDWPAIHRERQRPGVTLLLLWEEYRAAHPEGYGYSRFCDLYREWRGTLPVTMRQDHKAGEKLFVDYAGQTVAVTDPKTGEVREAQVFVATMGASNFTYAEATWTQSLPDWIGSHVRALEFLRGVPAIIVCDYVPGLIIAVMFPAGICARREEKDDLRRRVTGGGQHNYSQRLQPFEQRRVVPPNRTSGESRRSSSRRLAGLKGLGFHAQTHLGVTVGGLQAHVPQPGTNDVDLDAGLQEVDCRRMPKHVW